MSKAALWKTCRGLLAGLYLGVRTMPGSCEYTAHFITLFSVTVWPELSPKRICCMRFKSQIGDCLHFCI